MNAGRGMVLNFPVDVGDRYECNVTCCGSTYNIGWCYVPHCPEGSVFDESTGSCVTTPNDEDRNKDKDQGCTDADSGAGLYGDPVHAGTGNEYQSDTDYHGVDGLLFTRAYNSLDTTDHGLGYGWSSNVTKRLSVAGQKLTVYKADGSGEPFRYVNGQWQGDADTKLHWVQDAAGYGLRRQSGQIEHYDLNGRLLTETDRAGRTTSYEYSGGRVSALNGPHGHRLSFGYDANGRLSSLTDPAGQITRYTYDGNGNLVQVTRPDGSAKRYGYGDDAHPHALTAVTHVEANGSITLYASFAYNRDGKVIAHSLAGDQERFDFSYDSATQTTVTDAGGRKDILTFTRQLGVTKLLTRITAGDSAGLTQQYDARNNLIARTEHSQTTHYAYDAQNRLIAQTEAVGTTQERTTRYQYAADGLSLPSLIERPSVCPGATRQTRISYDTQNNPVRIDETGYTPTCTALRRSVAMSYDGAGRLTRIDGPRDDVQDITAFSYYDCQTGGGCGQPRSITNALGHTTTFDAYDANGRLLQKTDPNGLITRYAYDPRGHLASLVERTTDGATRTTAYAYTAAGKLAQVSLPDGRTLGYAYNGALDLVRVTDNLGGRIDYAYDSRGNATQTAAYDPDGALIRQIQRVHDQHNHLASLNDGGSITQHVHDALGRLISQTDPNRNPSTHHGYDALNRLIKTLDASGGVTAYGYDPNDNITQLIAPNGAATTYSYDDLGNLLSEASPDRGLTTYAYDSAGNLKARTDARGITASYSHDALNRLTATRYSGLNDRTIPSADITLTYDNATDCTHGLGRLCQARDQSGVSTYAYDPYGRLSSETHTASSGLFDFWGGRVGGDTLRYQYDAGDRIIASATLTDAA
ncbi:MAG: DUF6531 domain-containing protein [Pseudomonadota bacterium]